MRLSWKIFSAIFLITVLTFSIGGYLMISSFFRSALERELNSAQEELRTLRYSFETAITTLPTVNDSVLSDLAAHFFDAFGREELAIRLSDPRTNPLYQSASAEFTTAGLFEQVDATTLAYLVIRQDEQFWLQTTCTVQVSQDLYYLESLRNINTLFLDRDAQTRIYRNLMLVVVLLNSVIIVLVAVWISHPISSLSRATRSISRGRYEKRVDIRSRDEIGQLAADFNQMAESLAQKIHDLEDAAQRQEDFVASFAHELKTPLTSIIGYADMLRSRKMSEEHSLLAADYIYSEGKRLEKLSLRLLELIVLKKRDFSKQSIPAQPFLSQIYESLRPLLAAKQITLYLEAEEGTIWAEPDLLKTLLYNLLDNARKALADNPGAILLKGKREEKGYFLSVEDNGKGMPPEAVARVTEAFYMIDKSRARAEGGAGLGLAICAEIAAVHGTRLTIYSQEERGTIVSLTIKDVL